jgi:regulator of sigma E protease
VLLSWTWIVIAVVLLFGAAVFVHELGHFLVARWCGLKVEGFSIGFGPKIVSWQRNGIDYAWRWIPAGGYVKLPQMVTSEAIEGKTTDSGDLPKISPWSKILVSFAGPVMNALFAFGLASLIYFVGLPVRVNPAIIGGVEPGSAEEKMGLRAGDRIVEVNGKTVKSFEDVVMTTAMALTNVLPVTIERDGARKTYYLTARVNDQLGLKMLDLEPTAHPVIEDVTSGSAGEAAGLKKDDEVLSFAGVPIVGQDQLVNLIRKRPGQPTPMEVKRGAQRLTLTATPRLDPIKGVGLLGIRVGASAVSVYQVQKPGPLPWELVGQLAAETFNTIGALLHSRQTGVGVKDLSGPPGILAVLAAELKVDYRLGLRFMVLLNISLTILNLLPLPVLDGGHIAMAVLEKLRGRPLSPRVQEYATTVFAFLLISFMLYVSYNDVVRRFPLLHSLFHQQVEFQHAAGQSNAPPAASPNQP